MPIDDLALATSALANGLAFEEASDLGSVPDALLGDLLAVLLAPAAPGRKRADAARASQRADQTPGLGAT